MSTTMSIEAVRLALGMLELQARVAGQNVARANEPGARAMNVDLSGLEQELDSAASGGSSVERLRAAGVTLRGIEPVQTDVHIEVDAQVGDMVVVSTQFQALAEALNRHFGLMRLAATGRA